MNVLKIAHQATSAMQLLAVGGVAFAVAAVAIQSAGAVVAYGLMGALCVWVVGEAVKVRLTIASHKGALDHVANQCGETK